MEVEALRASLRRVLKDASTGRSAVHVPEASKTDFVDRLREVLGACVNPQLDCVGHLVPMAGTGDYIALTVPLTNGLITHVIVSSVSNFGQALIQEASILGVDRVVDLLVSWRRGEPLQYRTCRLAELTLNGDVTLANGVRIIALPWSSDALPAGLPSLGNHRIQADTYVGRSVVQIETIATPALFCPKVGAIADPVRAKPTVPFDATWGILSLAQDAYIENGHTWCDYSELSATAPNIRTASRNSSLSRMVDRGRWSTHPTTGVIRFHPHKGSISTLSQNRIDNLLAALLPPRNATRSQVQKSIRLHRAIARWMKSKSPDANLTDRFIDLRIALEALLLDKGPHQPLGFKVAVHGAWLAGKDPGDRRDAFNALSKAYQLASKLVHGGSEEEHYIVALQRAQKFCRKGILRVLEEGEVSDWEGLILGDRGESSG